MAGNLGHPTILIVCEDSGFRDVLIRQLQQKSYLALEAQNATEALEVVIRHSRRIHLLLADESDNARVMAATLKPYRPYMNVIHISAKQEFGLILTEVGKILKPPYESVPAQ